MRKGFKIGIVILLLCTVSYVFYSTHKRNTRGIVKTIHPEIRDIRQSLLISGTIVPAKIIDIKSTIPGVLEKLLVDVGDEVQRGTAIARVRYVKDPVEYERSRNEVEAAREKLQFAERSFQRTETLFLQNLISVEEYESEKTNLAVYRSQFNTISSEMKMLQGDYSGDRISNIISATDNGTILELSVKEGGSVMARGSLYEGTTIARIADLSTLLFKGSVLEIDRVQLTEGMKVDYSIASLRDTSLSGTIISISPMGSITNGVSRFDVVASIDIPLGLKSFIFAGGTANAEVIIEEKRGVLSLNEKYFQFKGDTIYVNTLDANNNALETMIIPGISDGIFTEIVSGLSIDDSIILDPSISK